MDLRKAMHDSIANGYIDKIVDQETLESSLQEFCLSIFRTRAERDKKHIFSEKTPFNALIFKELRELFPTSKHLLILRDPRSVVASMLKVGASYRNKGEEPPHFVRSVRSAVSSINNLWDLALDHASHDENTKIVYYEDLVSNPKSVAADLCAFLDVAFEPGMLEIENASFDTAQSASANSRWYKKEQLTNAIHSGSVKPSGKLTDRQKKLVELYVTKRPELERYALSDRKPTLLEIIHWKLSHRRASKHAERILKYIRFS